MKNQLNVFIFLVLIAAILYATWEYLAGWIVGVLTISFTLSVIFIAIVIFFENRHPTKTLTWLLVLAAFPLVGFFFYLLFGRNYQKERTFFAKAMQDEDTALEVEGERTLNEDDIQKMGGHQQLLLRLAHRLGDSSISFSSKT